MTPKVQVLQHEQHQIIGIDEIHPRKLLPDQPSPPAQAQLEIFQNHTSVSNGQDDNFLAAFRGGVGKQLKLVPLLPSSCATIADRRGSTARPLCEIEEQRCGENSIRSIWQPRDTTTPL